MKLMNEVINIYSQEKKNKEAQIKAIKYFKESLSKKHKLWKELYEDSPVGKRIYNAITGYIHNLSNRCGYCQDTIFHKKSSNIDHVLPSSIYPQFTFIEENLVRVCMTCNMLKLDDDFYTPVLIPKNDYRQYSALWKCFHPRHHIFSHHIERLVIQTNHLHFRAYWGKTTEGKKLCSSLLIRVSEFEAKSNSNPTISESVKKLNHYMQSNNYTSSASVRNLLSSFLSHM